MREAEIEVGGYYFDGKLGVRKVIGIGEADGAYSYRILSARQEFSYERDLTTPCGVKKVAVVGGVSACTRQSLAAWAKCRLSEEAALLLAAGIAANRIKLTAAESACLRKLKSSGNLDTSKPHEYPKDESRVVKALARKGFFEIHDPKVAEFKITAQTVALLCFWTNF